MKGDETRHEINEKRRKGKGGKSRVRWEARRRGKKEKVAERKRRRGIEGGKRRGEQVEREKTWRKVERKERRERKGNKGGCEERTFNCRILYGHLCR